MQYCSLQYQNILPSPVISTTGCCFCFDSVSSFFLELFLHSSPVAYWAPMDLGSSFFSVLSFCLFILFILKARRLKWFAILFSRGPHFVRALHHDPPILGGPTWHGLDKAVVHMINWLFFCEYGFHSVCALMGREKVLWKLPDERDWLRWKLGLVLMVGTCSVNL